jgi:hypothetical protein
MRAFPLLTHLGYWLTNFALMHSVAFAFAYGGRTHRDEATAAYQIIAPPELRRWRNSIRRTGKGHEPDGHNGARFRLTHCDLFYDGKLLGRVGRPYWHYEPAPHFQLLD